MKMHGQQFQWSGVESKTIGRGSWGLLLAILLTACATTPDQPTESEKISAETYASQKGLEDRRGRFREIFCQITDQRGMQMPDAMPCTEALIADGEEPGANGRDANLGTSNSAYLVLLVPGLGWDCFAEWLDYDSSVIQHLGQFGYKTLIVPGMGLGSSDENAINIRDYVADLSGEDSNRPIVLVGYSKGAPDSLVALNRYPELAARVVALVSLAGAVGGSPLADEASQSTANWLKYFPEAGCSESDDGAVNSLRTKVRQQWLRDNHLPSNIHYYTVATYPQPERVSGGLSSGYKTLGKIDRRNDAQLFIYDQMIPSSTLLAYVNADRWAVAVPIARQHEIVAAMVVDQNNYPREILFESILRFIEEDIGGTR